MNNIRDFVEYLSWFRKYETLSTRRYHTFRIALNIFAQSNRKYIVETGCARELNDYGGGYSTVIFGEFCQFYDRKLVTIDNCEEHLNRCKNFASFYQNFIEYKHSDSVEYLRTYQYFSEVGLVFLDSMDCPIDGTVPLDSQQHQYNEFIACESKILPGTVLLLDDNAFILDETGIGNQVPGKTGVLKDYLFTKNEWTCLYDDKQSLWIKR